MDAEHGRADTQESLLPLQRAALARLRDQAALAEYQGDVGAHRVGLEEATLLRQRATEDVQADLDARCRAARQAVDKRLRRAREAAFGESSLFDERPGLVAAVLAGDAAPVAPASLDVVALRGLPGGDARSAWAHLRVLCGEEFRLGGLRNADRACFANALLQVLLRLPTVSLRRSHHAGVCDRASDCLACRLWRSRGVLGQRPTAVPPLVATFGEFAGLGRFGDGLQHDLEEFCCCLLYALRDREVTAGRFADWAGAGLGDAKASHVERLFSFVLEQRSRCDACGGSAATAVRYSFDRVLRLPVPESAERGRV